MVLSVACTYFSLSGETSGNHKKVLASSAVQSKLIVTFMPLLLKDRRGDVADHLVLHAATLRSEEHTSELQSLMRNSYAVFCLTKKNTTCSTCQQQALHMKTHKIIRV